MSLDFNRSNNDSDMRMMFARTIFSEAINYTYPINLYAKSGLNHLIACNNVSSNQTRKYSYALQEDLPRLPVPTLEQTMEKYLRTVRPHLNDFSFEKTTELVKNFMKPDGDGSKLQRLLIGKAKKEENWLKDWWLNGSYLEFRSPVVVFSSPGLVFPYRTFKNLDERLCYASKVILGALDYKKLIDENKIPIDKMGKQPMDMQQYNVIFGTCRVPSLPRDSLQYHPDSKHIIVAHNNHFFKVYPYGKDGNFLSVNQLCNQLKEIVENSPERAKADIGVLTSDDRNNWARSYDALMQSKKNARSVADIQTSLFLMCLDGPLPNPSCVKDINASGQLIHGCGSTGYAGNRWYDKTIQFIVGDDGTNGLTYEHSPAEGQPVAVMTDYVVNYVDKKGEIIPDAPIDQGPVELEFELNETIEKCLATSRSKINRLVTDLDIASFTYNEYGKDFIKSHKMSPDSYLQMAMQYAFYLIHNYPGAHYESAATRIYLHGRTETIRSCSIESVAFAKAMLDNQKSDQERVALLRAAVDGHKKYTIDAIQGFGVDRHLLGLKLTAIENNFEIPALYKDEGYTKSNYFRLSTSQVATRCDGYMVYGPLVEDGYACCYNPRDNDMKFGITAHVSCPDTTAECFKNAMIKSLNHMRDILVNTQKSKL